MARIHTHECARCTRRHTCAGHWCPKKALCPGCALAEHRGGMTRKRALAAADRLAVLRGRAMARAQGRLR